MLCAVPLLAAAPALAAEPFSYAGIGLDATAARLKPVFPNLEVRRRLRASRGQGQSRPRLRHRASRREEAAHRAGELRAPGRLPGYPKCKVLEARLRAGLGAPTEIRTVATEPLRRSDRVWKGARESMTLVCFAGPNGELLAEAVVIAEK